MSIDLGRATLHDNVARVQYWISDGPGRAVRNSGIVFRIFQNSPILISVEK
jgi:hypothetical protein